MRTLVLISASHGQIIEAMPHADPEPYAKHHIFFTINSQLVYIFRVSFG
jgi:hypothetical protein